MPVKESPSPALQKPVKKSSSPSRRTIKAKAGTLLIRCQNPQEKIYGNNVITEPCGALLTKVLFISGEVLGETICWRSKCHHKTLWRIKG